MPRILIPAHALTVFAAASAAQDAAGTVEGTLALEPVRWSVATGGDGRPASWWQQVGRGRAMQIAAFPTRAVERAEEALVIRFVAEGAPEASRRPNPAWLFCAPTRPCRSVRFPGAPTGPRVPQNATTTIRWFRAACMAG